MRHLSFEKRIARLSANVANGADPGFADTIRELLLANIYHLYPDYGLNAMNQLAQDLYVLQKRSIMELEHCSELLAKTEAVFPAAFDPKSEAAIYVGFHYGAYRLIAPVLLTKGVRLTIVMDKMVARDQQATFEKTLSQVARRAGMASDSFAFRDTSDPGLLRGMARDLKSGRSLLLYLDGNSGTDSKSAPKRTENLVRIPFLGLPLDSRIGIPVLSHLVGAPIVPIRNTRSESVVGESLMEFLDPIRPSGERSSYTASSLRSLWSVIEGQVREQPQHWESLRYVNKYIAFEKAAPPPDRDPNSAKPMYFDHRRYSIRFDLPEAMMFDRRRMELFSPGGYLKEILTRASSDGGADIRSWDLSEETMKWMSSKGMLIETNAVPATV